MKVTGFRKPARVAETGRTLVDLHTGDCRPMPIFVKTERDRKLFAIPTT